MGEAAPQVSFRIHPPLLPKETDKPRGSIHLLEKVSTRYTVMNFGGVGRTYFPIWQVQRVCKCLTSAVLGREVDHLAGAICFAFRLAASH
jgi:hypothetical protein